MNDFSDLKEFAIELAYAASGAVKKYFDENINIETKKDGTPVTIADSECEKLMRKMITDRFPDHGILGEEYGETKGRSQYTWVLDPIDGTKSFISGGFDFGTLIGILEDGMPILGIISHPLLDQITIGDNESCTFNGKSSSVKATSQISSATCLVNDVKLPGQYFSKKGFDDLASRVREIRTWGNCFGYSLLARGLADIMIDPIVSRWDFLPIIPIIRGAGGVVTDYHGKDPMNATSLIASTLYIHDEVVQILNS